MRKAILILLLMPFVFSAMAQKKPSPKKAPLHTKTTMVQFKPIDMLRFFYIAYMRPYVENNQTSEIYSKQSQLRHAYCTPRCQARYLQLSQEDDGDPFIKTIGLDPEAIRSLAFKKDPKQPGKYTVTYDLGDKITIELDLVNVKGEWKIDYIN